MHCSSRVRGEEDGLLVEGLVLGLFVGLEVMGAAVVGESVGDDVVGADVVGENAVFAHGKHLNISSPEQASRTTQIILKFFQNCSSCVSLVLC